MADARPEQRLPAIETILARGKRMQTNLSSDDETRFALFGIEPSEPLPVGALTGVGDLGEKPQGDYYWLRADPVTLWADMARVIMTHYGFADLDEIERNEIENTIRKVLIREGMDFGSEHPERWTIALEKSLDFTFTPLQDALGMDAADALPDHPEALFWRRILNEIQMALHASPVNVRRRRRGQQEINSVWFWGGGYLPSSLESSAGKTVYANHPVTRGLALVSDSDLKDLSSPDQMNFEQDGSDILIDWSTPHYGSAIELEHLERFAEQLIEAVKNQGLSLQFYAEAGVYWSFDRARAKRFWKRLRPVSSYQFS